MLVNGDTRMNGDGPGCARSGDQLRGPTFRSDSRSSNAEVILPQLHFLPDRHTRGDRKLKASVVLVAGFRSSRWQTDAIVSSGK